MSATVRQGAGRTNYTLLAPALATAANCPWIICLQWLTAHWFKRATDEWSHSTERAAHQAFIL